MQRALICLAGLALVGAQPVVGQEQERQANYVYEAFYRVSGADMEEWNQQYREYSVPVLRALQEEGVIEGWNQWQHQTGGEYNVRLAMRTYDWASLETFWDEYLSRLQEAMPEAAWQSGSRMIIEHRDEIWDIGAVNVPANMQASHIYASTFRVNFADMTEWNRMWTEVATPILEQAMSDGILSGWVKLNHNTGGPHNSKILYFFDSWDDIDDMFARLGQTMQEEHPDEMTRIGELSQAHDDVIWVPTSESESEGDQ